MTIEKDYFLLLPPYPSGIFVKKNVPKIELERIMYGIRRAILKMKYIKGHIEPLYLKKYFTNGEITSYPISWEET